MIVKIWPIRGTQNLNRILAQLDALKNTEEHTRIVDNTLHVGAKNGIEHAIGAGHSILKHVSSFNCSVENAKADFSSNRNAILFAHSNKEYTPNTISAYHMVQAFPKDVAISADEANLCGLELLEMLGKYQGVVFTFMRFSDDDAERRSPWLYNQIVFSAYMLADMLDPAHPDRIKYNDCKESYAQLQAWNDEIAMAHGLPVIL